MRNLGAWLGVLGVLLLGASCSSGGNDPIQNGGHGGSTGSCAGGQVSCGAVCVNTATDSANCGACGKACSAGQSCTNGTCSCAGGLTACSGSCVSTQSSSSNCGACGNVCPTGQLCSQGKCSAGCAPGEMQCTTGCAVVQTDATNCGFCGNACVGGQACVNGACGCPTGQATCSGACVDTMSNAMNCGACGTVCTTGQSCVGGHCTTGAGAGGSTGAGGAPGAGGGGGISALGGTTGTAGTGAGGGTAGAPAGRNGCPAPAGLIADFEEGTGKDPAVVPIEDRTGAFEIFNDMTSMSEKMAVESSGGTTDCDKWALHVTGSGYTSWGAGVGFSLVGTPKSPTPYNAQMHQFTGIKFKAKLGTGADSKSAVRFNISTPWTENKENPGGQCTPTTATDTKAKADCYQHVGKFLPPGSGDNELGSSWKAYTFCFDRDLYPLSLPSNLTNDQRNNIATSILKVQFQFNVGKDYSGAYTNMYPKFSPSLPFDFWLDDVSFFTGDCPNTVTSPSNGTPAKAFPQNAAVGSCMPATNASKFAGAITKAYATWTKNFVQNDHIVSPEQSNAITSEAMGYGMMIAAAMGDKTAFDKFWGYVKANGGSGNGLMTWKNGGSGSASDADIDIAYALLMANLQWPSGGYKSASDSMASAILSQDVVSNIIRGGSGFHDAPFNASYFMPAELRKLSGLSGIIAANYSLVNANVAAPTAGIPTDWASASDGKPSGAGSAQVTSEIVDGNNGAMGYDAARVPWRLGMDACLGGTDTAAVKSIVNFFATKYDAGASIDLMKAGWLKSTGGVHTKAIDSQATYIGPMGAAAMATGNAVMRDRAFRTILDILESGDFNHTYYPTTLGLLTALMMSGNFPTP